MRSAPMRFLLLLAACLLTSRADEYEFWEACEAGDTKEMENLLEAASDIDLNYPDEDGRTPLLLAALHDRAAAARLLLARGADAEAVGRWPGPPDGPLATAAALKQPLQKPLAVRGGGIDKAGVVKAVNIAWGFYAAQMILVPSKVHNDHFEEKSTKMTEFWARGHGVSIAVGIYALTQLDTDTAFKAAMAWVAGIGVAYPYNAKFNWFDTYKVKYPMHYVPEVLMVGLLGAGFVANRAE